AEIEAMIATERPDEARRDALWEALYLTRPEIEEFLAYTRKHGTLPWVYHVLRHSFISALASEGVDQRVIDEVVGHQSEEQRRRYRHLYPEVMRAAIEHVFG